MRLPWRRKPRARKYLHGRGDAVGEWVHQQLGLDPAKVNRVVVTLDCNDAVTADVHMYISGADLAALQLSGMVARAPAYRPDPYD